MGAGAGWTVEEGLRPEPEGDRVYGHGDLGRFHSVERYCHRVAEICPGSGVGGGMVVAVVFVFFLGSLVNLYFRR